jgi:sugar/nucleoside kinase (ribokinase family)
MAAPRALFVGRSTFDILYRLDVLPVEDSKVFAREFYAAPGGPALNAALTHALLGGHALLVSAVGGGKWAAALREELLRRGVELLDLADGTAYETPLSTTLLNAATGSRTIVNPPASLVRLPPLAAEWSNAVPASWGAIPPVVLCDGFFLEEASALLTACREAGAALCLDGGSWKPGTAEIAPLLTVAICSERFALPGQTETPGGDPESVMAWFAAQGVPCVAVTRGARSILGWERGRGFEIEVAKIEATDTLGAGDVLHGAFCHFFAMTRDFEHSLRKASAIATLSCQSLGIPTTFGGPPPVRPDGACAAPAVRPDAACAP